MTGLNILVILILVISRCCNGQQYNSTTLATTTTTEDRNKIIAWFEDLSTDKLVLLVAAVGVFLLLVLISVMFYICYHCCKRRYTYSPQQASPVEHPVAMDPEIKKNRYGFAVSAARASISELSPTSQKCAPWSDTTSHQLNKVNNKVTRKLEKTVFVVENENMSNGKQGVYRPRASSVSTSINSKDSNIMRQNRTRKKSLIRQSSQYPEGPSSNDNPLCKNGRDIDLFY